MVDPDELDLVSRTGERRPGFNGWRLGSVDLHRILHLPPDDVLVQIFGEVAPSKELRVAIDRGEVLRGANYLIILLPVRTKPAVRQRFLAAVAAHEATRITRS